MAFYSMKGGWASLAESRSESRMEDAMPRKANVEDLKKENKALEEELSYYRHKSA